MIDEVSKRTKSLIL